MSIFNRFTVVILSILVLSACSSTQTPRKLAQDAVAAMCGTQNSPEFLLRRNPVSIALAAAESASDAPPVEEKELNGKMYKYAAGKTKAGEDLGLYFDPQSKMLAAYEVKDTESIIGDVQAQYILSDYKAVDGITLPHHITIHKEGKDYSDVQFTSLAVNDPAADAVF